MRKPSLRPGENFSPIPEDLPLPFSFSDVPRLAPPDRAQDSDWLDAVQDHRPLRGRPPTPDVQQGRDPSSLTTPRASQGTVLGRRLRHGIDRWHHPDGSIRSRLKERLAAVTATDQDDPATPAVAPENENEQLDPTAPLSPSRAAHPSKTRQPSRRRLIMVWNSRYSATSRVPPTTRPQRSSPRPQMTRVAAGHRRTPPRLQ